MFDPFGDYASRGYLRNHAAQSNIQTVKQLEHAAFRGKAALAIDALMSRDRIDYQVVREVHLILFSDVYPWAGEDRCSKAAGAEIVVDDISNLYSHPYDIELAVNHALERGQNTALIREKPGEVLGDLSHAHPFLVGNGRVNMIVHGELCRRAAIHIDWERTERVGYLSALTSELQQPGKGHLDAYLSAFVRQGAEYGRNGLSTHTSVRDTELETSELSSRSVLISAREINVQVTRDEIEASARNNRWYDRLRSSLAHISQQVFKDPTMILESTERAAFAGRLGSNTVGDDLAADPRRFGEFRGKDGRFSRRDERQEHRNAVAMQYALRSQVREYIALVHSVRQQLSHEKHDLARRGMQSVPTLSESLSEAIRLGKALDDQQTAELKNALNAFQQRFGDDVGHLRTLVKFRPGLAERHGIGPTALQEVRNTIRKLDKGVANLRDQDCSQDTDPPKL